MIPRSARQTLEHLAQEFRIVAITGPRQSGKTTLARLVFPHKPYVSLEDANERLFATEDARGFFARFPDGAILDEAQHVPALFSYLNTLVDLDPRPGRFVITGSQNFTLLSKVTQSLAGRVGILQLLPLTLAEVAGAHRVAATIDELLVCGFYPSLHATGGDAKRWFESYIISYVERDVRQVINVQDLILFQRFIGLCAARTGQLLNLSSLAADCGVSHVTARSWLSVLQASYIVHLLAPHFENLGKRLIKSPKLYFVDVGLAAHLVGVEDSAHARVHSARPALFETFVVGELLKQRFNRGLRSNLFFWRDNIGTEVDVVVEDRNGLFPIEIKSGQTFRDDFLANLHKFRKYAGPRAAGAGLVYGGDESYVRSGVTVRAWRDL